MKDGTHTGLWDGEGAQNVKGLLQGNTGIQSMQTARLALTTSQSLPSESNNANQHLFGTVGVRNFP